MIGVGVGLPLYHQISASASSVNGPAAPVAGLPVCADAAALNNSNPTDAEIALHMSVRVLLRYTGAGVGRSGPAPRRDVQVHQRLSAGGVRPGLAGRRHDDAHVVQAVAVGRKVAGAFARISRGLARVALEHAVRIVLYGGSI